MRLIVLCGSMLCALVMASVAGATPPTRETSSYTVSVTLAAGSFCDVGVQIVDTVNNTLTQFDGSNGRYLIHVDDTITYTNLANNAVVTSHAHGEAIGTYGVGETDVGLFQQLRDATTGKLISVNVGQIVFSNNSVISFTPHANLDFLAAICSALGANAA